MVGAITYMCNRPLPRPREYDACVPALYSNLPRSYGLRLTSVGRVSGGCMGTLESSETLGRQTVANMRIGNKWQQSGQDYCRLLC